MRDNPNLITTKNILYFFLIEYNLVNLEALDD